MLSKGEFMSTIRFYAWFVWIIASLFYAYQYILRVMPNIMLNDITQQFQIDATVFGQFSGVYYLGYSLMHLPIGIALDRFGPRKVMTFCILLTVLGLIPIIFAHQWVYPLIGRMMIGIGSSAAILGTFKIIRMSFKERHFSRMLGFSVMIGLIGAIYGGGPVSYLCTLWGYKVVVGIFASTGVLLAALTYFMVPEIAATKHSSVLANIKILLTHHKILWVCFFAGLMLGPLEGFSDVWGSGFLKQVYGLSSTTANYLPSMLFIGMCFGAPVLSMIAEKTGHYLGAIIVAGGIMSLSFIVLLTGTMPVTGIIISFVLVGICCAYQILAIYKVSTYVPENLAGLATAIANMIIMSFGYAFHTVIGFVINIYGGINSSEAFTRGIGIIPLTLIIGTIGFLFMAYQEKQKRSKTFLKECEA